MKKFKHDNTLYEVYSIDGDIIMGIEPELYDQNDDMALWVHDLKRFNIGDIEIVDSDE